jgi:hypothetical protein
MSSDVADLMGQFLDRFETMEHRLRMFDSALRFAHLSYPMEAAVFEGCLAIAEQEPLPATPEHETSVQEARELFSRAFRDLRNREVS